MALASINHEDAQERAAHIYRMENAWEQCNAAMHVTFAKDMQATLPRFEEVCL